MSKKITNIHNRPLQNKVEIKHHSDGKVKSKTPYVNDKEHGLETRWRTDSSKWYEKMWIEGKQQGLETWWHENGEKWYEQMWIEGKKHGVETRWYKNGTKTQEVYFIRDEIYARIGWDEVADVTEAKLPTAVTTTNRKPIAKSKKITSTRS